MIHWYTENSNAVHLGMETVELVLYLFECEWLVSPFSSQVYACDLRAAEFTKPTSEDSTYSGLSVDDCPSLRKSIALLGSGKIRINPFRTGSRDHLDGLKFTAWKDEDFPAVGNGHK